MTHIRAADLPEAVVGCEEFLEALVNLRVRQLVEESSIGGPQTSRVLVLDHGIVHSSRGGGRKAHGSNQVSVQLGFHKAPLGDHGVGGRLAGVAGLVHRPARLHYVAPTRGVQSLTAAVTDAHILRLQVGRGGRSIWKSQDYVFGEKGGCKGISALSKDCIIRKAGH